jgi:hypothetical protein
MCIGRGTYRILWMRFVFMGVWSDRARCSQGEGNGLKNWKKRETDQLLTVLCPFQEFFTLHVDVTIADEGLQKSGLCSELRVFEQGGIFIMPHLLWNWALGFSSLIQRTAPFSCLLQHTGGCWGPILNRILTGLKEGGKRVRRGREREGVRGSNKYERKFQVGWKKEREKERSDVRKWV